MAMIVPQPISLTSFLSGRADKSPFLAVLGRPIAHSLSPLIHNYALRSHGIKAEYFPIVVSENEEDKLDVFFHHPNFAGANITIPLKQKVGKLTDQKSDAVIQTGAVNTIYKLKDGRLASANTDISGFLTPLEAFRNELKGKSAMLFGSGGAAKAVIHALKSLGMSELFIVSRNPQNQSDEGITFLSYSEWAEAASQCQLIVNASPLGMYPNVMATPVERVHEKILKGKICYDLIYRPAETRFLSQAKQQDARIINGLEMFIGQAAEAYELFTTHKFPLDEIRILLNEHLRKTEKGKSG